MQKKIEQFFETHPEAKEVHEALGVLFTDAEKAVCFVGGTTASVSTHTRTAPVEEPTAPVEAPAPPVEAPAADVKEAIEKGKVLATKAKAKVSKK